MKNLYLTILFSMALFVSASCLILADQKENLKTIRPSGSFIEYQLAEDEQIPDFPFQELLSSVRYPKLAKTMRIEGDVILRIMLLKNSTVSKCSVVYSDHPLLNSAAIEGIRKMKSWKCAYQFGKPIDMTIQIPVKFVLNTKTGLKRNYEEGLIDFYGKFLNYEILYDTILVNKNAFDDIDIEDLETKIDDFIPVDKEINFNSEDISVALHYPSDVILFGETGSVYVAALVGRNSKLLKAFVQTSDYKNFNTSALKAVLASKTWEAATLENSTVASWISIPIKFEKADTTFEFSSLEGASDSEHPYLVSNIKDLIKDISLHKELITTDKKDTLTFKVDLNENGTACDIEVLSSTNENFNLPVSDIIAGHHFQPCLLSDGTRAKATLKFPIVFSF